MIVMWEQKELSVKQLGEFLYLDSGTLTPLLKTMEKKGWVTRKRSEKDERVLTVTITEAGEKLREKAITVPNKIAECINITAEEAMQLYTILHKILVNI